MANPLLNRVKEIVAKYGQRGVLRNDRLDVFNNRPLAISALMELGFVPDDQYAPKFWIRKDVLIHRGQRTMIETISDTLLESGVYYLGDYDIRTEDARHIITTLKKRNGWGIQPVKGDKRIIGYELTSIKHKKVNKKPFASCN